MEPWNFGALEPWSLGALEDDGKCDAYQNVLKSVKVTKRRQMAGVMHIGADLVGLRRGNVEKTMVCSVSQIGPGSPKYPSKTNNLVIRPKHQ